MEHEDPKNKDKFKLAFVNNDQCFVHGIVKDEVQGESFVNVRSVLFCLSFMQRAISPALIKAFAALDPLAMISGWLSKLIEYHAKLLKLQDINEEVGENKNT